MIKRMIKVGMVVALLCAMVFPGSGHQAQAQVADSVDVDSVILSRCGQQEIPFSGTATYSGTPHVVVELDGVQVFHSHAGTSSWITGFVTASVGQHTVTGKIYSDSAGVHGSLLASDSMVFSIANCGGGDEQDCCPGPDTVAPTTSPTAVGKVKGTKTVVAVSPTPTPHVAAFTRFPKTGFPLPLWTMLTLLPAGALLIKFKK